MIDQLSATVTPAEGWHVLHLLYKIEHGAWALLSPDEEKLCKEAMEGCPVEAIGSDGE